MTDALFAAVGLHGAWIVAASTFLSCLAMPIPASFVMLAAGAFAASGDLSLVAVSTLAFAGAALGDQAGFLLGRRGGAALSRMAGHGRKSAALMRRAGRLLGRWGVGAVFLSRWLFSPLGPYVNLLCGAGGMSWRSFSLGSLTGEALWVSIYVSLGHAFTGQITQLAALASDMVGLASSLAILVLSGWALRRRARRRAAPGRPPG